MTIYVCCVLLTCQSVREEIILYISGSLQMQSDFVFMNKKKFYYMNVFAYCLNLIFYTSFSVPKKRVKQADVSGELC